jgi:hypothetical protein
MLDPNPVLLFRLALGLWVSWTVKPPINERASICPAATVAPVPVEPPIPPHITHPSDPPLTPREVKNSSTISFRTVIRLLLGRHQ